MELNELRNEINKVDEELLDAFLKRMKLCWDIGEVKKTEGLPVLNRAREREILDKVQKASGDLAPYSHRLYTMLFELSRAYQSSGLDKDTKVKALIEKSLQSSETLFPQSGAIAVQGVEGAYSQMAADRIFPRGSLVFFKNFEGVFDAVEMGFCDFGVLPIENSSNGSVRAVYDLLQTKKVSIVRSTRLCISHELLAKPGAKLSGITEIHSHEQALGQCSEFLKKLGDKVKIVADPNTAMAAQFVAESPRNDLACICSSDCAKLYGLKSLDVNIRNSDNNYTRFIVISREPKVYPGANKISLVLALDHKPGALYDVLSKFAALEVNLLKLESCPMVGHDFEFLFFFEIEASAADPKIIGMLSDLETSCPSFTYLGAYQEV